MDIALAIFEFVVLALSISMHDCAQAWVASRLGDPTARMLGRLSLNPVRHFDLFGTLIWPALSIFVFHSSLILGWGKPIPVTPRNFRHASRDEMLVYLAGPVAHLFAAILFLILLIILKHTNAAVAASTHMAAALARGITGLPTTGLPSIFPLVLLLYFGILMNLLLFAFNLIPLPSLDGGKILRHFLPYNAQQTFDRIGIYLLFAFFFFGFRLILAIFTPLLVTFDALLNAF